MDIDDLMSAWTHHLRYSLVPAQFPRQMQKNRFEVHNLDEYLQFLTRNYDQMHCFTSLYSEAQLTNKIIDTIFIEIDGVTVPDAMADAIKLEKALLNRGLSWRKYFSGRRGFHYYIDFDPIKFEHPRETIRQYVSSLPKVIDPHVIGNIRQLVRIPYTRHPATSLYCSAMDGDAFNISHAINPEIMLLDVVSNDHLSDKLSDIDAEIHDVKKYVSAPRQAVSMYFFPPCIVSNMTRLQNKGELSHQARLHVTAFLAKIGKTEDQIELLFKRNAEDYNEHYTRQQIKSIIDGNLYCYSCKRASSIGICPFDAAEMSTCSFFPSINMFVRSGPKLKITGDIP